MTVRYKAPRGTRDILPDEVWKWQRVEAAFRATASRFGYSEIRVPAFEETQLFARGIGDTTDIVSKEMYTFQDKKGRSLTLRPEGTAGVVRAYIEHNMGRGGRLTKLYYYCSMFRYERPQAGRYRQFWQWGLEAIGSPNPGVDAEIIHFSVSLFNTVGIRGTRARVNSAGCGVCASSYNELLRRELAGRREEFCADCQVRFERNPRRMFDCKNERCEAVLAEATPMTDALCDDCRAHFEKVKEYLSLMSVDFSLDTQLARGLDYYTKTIFEIDHAGLGAQSALCGGGRYDGLVEELGGAPTPACGVSGGVGRLMLALEAEGGLASSAAGPQVYLAAVGDRAAMINAGIAADLRGSLSVEMDYQGRSLKAQMREAGRLGAKYVVILGEEEIAGGVAILREMETGSQEELPLEGLAKAVRKRLGARTTSARRLSKAAGELETSS